MLFVDGMPDDSIWNQMEIKGQRLADTLKVLDIAPPEEMNDDNAADVSDEDEEDPSDEDDDLTPEQMAEWQELLKTKPELFSEWESDEEQGEGDSELDEDMSGSDFGEAEEDDEEVELGSDEEEDEDAEMDDSDLRESDEDALENEDEEDDDEMDNDESMQAGPSRRSRPSHPTLDDNFFSIDDFNRFTEQAEAGNVSSGKLGGKRRQSENGKNKRKGILGEEDDEEEEDDDDEDGLGLDDEVGDLFGEDILAEAGDEGDSEPEFPTHSQCPQPH